MSTTQTLSSAPVGRRVRRGLITAAVLAALATAAGSGAAPATAEAGVLPFEGLRVPVVTVSALSTASMLAVTRAGLEALPNAADIPINQILKQIAAREMS